MARITILMNCPDQKGIIADVTNYIHKNKGNIEYIDQYVDVLFLVVSVHIKARVGRVSQRSSKGRHAMNRRIQVEMSTRQMTIDAHFT